MCPSMLARWPKVERPIPLKRNKKLDAPRSSAFIDRAIAGTPTRPLQRSKPKRECEKGILDWNGALTRVAKRAAERLVFERPVLLASLSKFAHF
jgi:hypothetical protein